MKDVDLNFYLAKLKEYKEFIAVAVVLLIVLLFCFKFIFAGVSDLAGSLKTHFNSKKSIAIKTKELEEARAKSEKEAAENKGYTLYLTNYDENDPLASFSMMFDDVLRYITQISDLKLKSFDYSLNPPDTASAIRQNSDSFAVCSLQFDLVGEYSQLKTFFDKIYQAPYFMAIREFAVQPYLRNPNYIIIKMTIELYVQKNKNNSFDDTFAHSDDEEKVEITEKDSD